MKRCNKSGYIDVTVKKEKVLTFFDRSQNEVLATNKICLLVQGYKIIK